MDAPGVAMALDKTPRPERIAEAGTDFVKTFEDAYLLSRELQLLTDLGQRGAPVPRVLATDYQACTITMTHGGIALTEELAQIGSRYADRLSWLRTTGPDILTAILAVCHHGVYHLDLACRNILVSKGRPMIVDFGLALCSRLPLQKPLWLIPSEKLHHPELIAVLRADWNDFFLHSPELRDYCARHGLDCPPPLTNGLALPGSAYSGYWPSTLRANTITNPMALVAYNLGALLEEIIERLEITGPDAQAVGLIKNQLQSLSDKTPALQRVTEAVSALQDLGGTPRPSARRTESASAPKEPVAQDGLNETRPAPKPVLSPTVKSGGLWPPAAGLHWPTRAAAVCLSLAGFALIDSAYRQTGAVLGDTAFISALVVMAAAIALVFTLAFSRGLLAQRMLGLVLSVLSLPFIVELWEQGASILQAGMPLVALSIGLVLAVALPQE